MVSRIVKALLYAIATFVVVCVAYLAISFIVYQRIVIPFANINDDIAKTAVKRRELGGKEYIICKWEATTGYNYQLIRDENGRRSRKYCLVNGPNPEIEATYDFLIADNKYVLYVVEKKDYIFEGENSVEYIVDGWDVLYPVKRDTLINIAPKYVLMGDLSEQETDIS